MVVAVGSKFIYLFYYMRFLKLFYCVVCVCVCVCVF